MQGFEKLENLYSSKSRLQILLIKVSPCPANFHSQGMASLVPIPALFCTINEWKSKTMKCLDIHSWLQFTRHYYLKIVKLQSKKYDSSEPMPYVKFSESRMNRKASNFGLFENTILPSTIVAPMPYLSATCTIKKRKVPATNRQERLQ